MQGPKRIHPERHSMNIKKLVDNIQRQCFLEIKGDSKYFNGLFFFFF